LVRITALLGRNGAGKTTLVRAIATPQAHERGTLTAAGHDVKVRPQAVRSSIGLAGACPGELVVASRCVGLV
jgi:ABC-type multidrug transport system ATPase subunit